MIEIDISSFMDAGAGGGGSDGYWKGKAAVDRMTDEEFKMHVNSVSWQVHTIIGIAGVIHVPLDKEGDKDKTVLGPGDKFKMVSRQSMRIETWDCNYHVLAAIEAYYGGDRTWEDFKELAGGKDNGLSQYEVSRLAKEAGFDVQFVSVKSGKIDDVSDVKKIYKESNSVALVWLSTGEGTGHANVLQKYETYENSKGKTREYYHTLDPIQGSEIYGGKAFNQSFLPFAIIFKGYKHKP